jgi:hypothetical protein
VTKEPTNTTKKLRKRPPGFEAHPERINRNGRPRTGVAMSDLIRARLEGEKGEAIIDGMIQRSLEGSDQATKILLDRAYGQAPQTVDIKTETQTLNQWRERAVAYFEKYMPDKLEHFCRRMDAVTESV